MKSYKLYRERGREGERVINPFACCHYYYYYQNKVQPLGLNLIFIYIKFDTTDS